MHPRVEDEWDDLVSAYPATQYLESPERLETVLDLDGRYNRNTCPVAVLVPVGYRATGPDGFLIPGDLRLNDGTALPTSDAAGLGMPGWLLVSFHFTDAAGRSTWRPTGDPKKGDNLLSYLSAIEAFLAHGCN
jgi:hypothetical protein